MGEFTAELNTYINNKNTSNKLLNRLQAFGYLAAALTAIFSAYIS